LPAPRGTCPRPTNSECSAYELESPLSTVLTCLMTGTSAIFAHADEGWTVTVIRTAAPSSISIVDRHAYPIPNLPEPTELSSWATTRGIARHRVGGSTRPSRRNHQELLEPDCRNTDDARGWCAPGSRRLALLTKRDSTSQARGHRIPVLARCITILTRRGPSYPQRRWPPPPWPVACRYVPPMWHCR